MVNFVALISHSYRTIPKISALIKRAKFNRNFLLAYVDTGIVFFARVSAILFSKGKIVNRIFSDALVLLGHDVGQISRNQAKMYPKCVQKR